MASERIIVGIDVGTTKVVTVVGEVGLGENVRVIGLGIEPSEGMKRGSIVDVGAVTEAIAASRAQAERTSGYEIGRAYVSLAGRHVQSINSLGVAPIREKITQDDMDSALAAASSIDLPHSRSVLHIIPRNYIVDNTHLTQNPIGMHAFRLEVEAHIVTADQSTLKNIESCINNAGMAVDRFVLNPIASAEATLLEEERKQGVVVVDIGGGTTDMAVYIEGMIWHTGVIEVGGDHITNDIVQLLNLPVDEAERIKIDYGNAVPESIAPDEVVMVSRFGDEIPTQILVMDLAQIIEARVDEIFTLVMQDLKRSGYDGLLPAGVVLTGGTAQLKNIRNSAIKVMHRPARVASPRLIHGMVDRLQDPAHATAAGLLHFARRIDSGSSLVSKPRRQKREGPDIGKVIGDLFGRLLPDED